MSIRTKNLLLASCSKRCGKLQRDLDKATLALELIRDAGGTTSDDAEFGKISYNGLWCAEQARAVLNEINKEAKR